MSSNPIEVPRNIKEYEAYRFARCGNPACGNIHVMLFDKYTDEVPSATTNFHCEDVPEMIKALQAVAYEYTTNKVK